MSTDKYIAQQKKIPNSVGLALSGGGFRATLFHLGAVRRLNELGVLSGVTTVSSVSGGSILNGYLASHASLAGQGIPDFIRQVSEPMRAFCGRDLRRWLALEAFIPATHNSVGLARAYDEHLTGGKLLAQIAGAPRHVFCATDLAFGVNWMFKKAECGDYQAGFLPTPDWTVGTAIAASSCFPPVFKPMELNLDAAKMTGGRFPAGATRDQYIRDLTVCDGGLYDNLGLEPIWKDHEIVLSSDGGALFAAGADTGFAWEVSRYISIPENQALAVRKRWLISNFIAGQLRGTYWGIGSSAYEYGIEQGYTEALAKEVIAAIRTDLDSFSDAEASVLENHGYWLADAAIRTWVPDLLPAVLPPLRVPNPEWAGPEPKIREALRGSGRRSLLGRAGG